MNPIKFITGFVTKTVAQKRATNQRAIAKEKGLEINCVVVEDAYRFYVTNPSRQLSLKEKNGRIPMVGEFMVIVYPKSQTQISEKVKGTKRKVKAMVIDIPVVETPSVPVIVKKVAAIIRKVAKSLVAFLPTKSTVRKVNRFSAFEMVNPGKRICASDSIWLESALRIAA